MTMRLFSVAACALALAACGGSSSKKAGNAAAGATFTYGAPAAASGTQAGALSGPVASVGAFTSAPSESGAAAVANFGGTTTALLGAASLVSAPSPFADVRARFSPGEVIGAAATVWDNPACVTTTASGVTMANCTVTTDTTSGGNTTHGVTTVNGSVSYSAANHSLTWDVSSVTNATVTGTTSGTGSVSLHYAGDLATTAGTIVGHMVSEISLSASAGGETYRIGVDESVDIDVGYVDATTCASRVTSGTLEAKRVWTARPTGVTPADLPNRAAKVTWTGCGTGTIQFGTN